MSITETETLQKTNNYFTLVMSLISVDLDKLYESIAKTLKFYPIPSILLKDILKIRIKNPKMGDRVTLFKIGLLPGVEFQMLDLPSEIFSLLSTYNSKYVVGLLLGLKPDEMDGYNIPPKNDEEIKEYIKKLGSFDLITHTAILKYLGYKMGRISGEINFGKLNIEFAEELYSKIIFKD